MSIFWEIPRLRSDFGFDNSCTHARKHLTSCNKSAKKMYSYCLLQVACQQVWNNLLTTCNNLVGLVARLFWQVRYMLDVTRLRLVTSCAQTCYKLCVFTRVVHELAIRVRQLASVAQLVEALHRNRKAATSIPTRGLIL
jgi:hypothetical protein